MALLCECPHRAHTDRTNTSAKAVGGVAHAYLDVIPVAVSFETRVVDAKSGFQVAVCGPCVDALH